MVLAAGVLIGVVARWAPLDPPLGAARISVAGGPRRSAQGLQRTGAGHAVVVAGAFAPATLV